ncbi:iron-containing alcohol dehydrogenase [Brevibacillus agri]|uniref:iron-containing alcohol dehydrogenase n=1 Tax=Brevibacillus agri TaxID=51101 RepID=UPI002E1A468F|nr:iron-containing alcohol dehydrogenase [Brevibacillus agri]MED1657217.1 iron-containing alcohol dehydrogenase [Brevibacillus agri]MED1689618.1 iron-containing alcohol dehydrogenase [Brevibacillus agri]MED1693904.1 iron-containing alcohol dehydrogenase [Brevibacillus agri]MED1698280.1 iron-containing alcohol dehydrogenase [Brevibacillus agri]
MNGTQSVQGIDFSFSFHLPTAIEFGYGKASRLGESLLSLGVTRVFVVTDQGVISAGLLEGLTGSLQAEGISYDVYADVEPDPSLETIDRCAGIFQEKAYDCIVAVGGGSPIDTAKGMRIVAANGGSIGDYAGVNRIPKASPIPLIVIPTTSGTGSEVTIFGVYSDWQNNVKVTVTSQHMAPTTALVDPALTMSLPAKMTAATGIDALAHGIETYFSLRSRPASDALALEAIATVQANLSRAVHDGSDIEARVGMSHGSLLAGMAFNNGFLGLAHAIGSALSGHCHVPHGIAIGLLLPHVVAFNTQARPEKAKKLAGLLGKGEQAEQAATAVAQLVMEIGLPTRLREVGVPEEKLADIAKDSFKSGMMKFNPRQPTEQEVLELLWDAF